jgi:hypothetical protein
MRKSHRSWTPERGRLRKATAIEHEPITIERLERALALCAYLVVLDGPVVLPFFERLERELAAMRQTQDAVMRAKRLLESYGGMTERRAIGACNVTRFASGVLVAIGPELLQGHHGSGVGHGGLRLIQRKRRLAGLFVRWLRGRFRK